MTTSDRYVKDVLTGERKRRSTLWRGPDRRYYTSEAAYHKMEDERQRQIQFMRRGREQLYNLVGIPFSEAPPKVLLKKEKDIRDAYGNEAFYEAVVRCSGEIVQAIEREGIDERLNAALYALGVLRNRLPGIAADLEREKMIISKTEQEPDIAETESLHVGRKLVYKDLTRI